MLSRVADSLYWMSRYLERAEHTARLLDVNLHQMLDENPGSTSSAGNGCSPASICRCPPPIRMPII